MQLSKLINSDPDIMGGSLVFNGTRVHIKTLWDYLEGGQPLDEFLDDFPSVTREHALAVLESAKYAMLDQVSHAHPAG